MLRGGGGGLGGSLSSAAVLLRADLNITPGTDHLRLKAHGETLRRLREAGAKIGILSHFGRPRGARVPSLSLAPVAPLLADCLGYKVAFAEDCVGETAESAMAALSDGGVLLMENTRFHAGEEENSPSFARALARLGSFYVNDAFSAAHRAHASTESLPRLLPCCAGAAMEAEMSALGGFLEGARRPSMAIVGGAKISDKIRILRHLAKRVDSLFVGGAMAHGFFEARAYPIGRSRAEPDAARLARSVEAAAAKARCRLIIPRDVIVAASLNESRSRAVSASAIPSDMMALDIGPETVAELGLLLDKTRTVLWNGPLGAFEHGFAEGTMAIARHIADRTRSAGLISLAGGGETATALRRARLDGAFSHLSMAGGALLEWLSGARLPALAALEENRLSLGKESRRRSL